MTPHVYYGPRHHSKNPSTFICLSFHVEFIHTYLYNSIYSCCYFIITSSDLVSSCYRLAFLFCFLVLSSALPIHLHPGSPPTLSGVSCSTVSILVHTFQLSEFFLPLLTLLCQCFVYPCSTLSPPISFSLAVSDFYLSLAHVFLSYLFPAFPVESQHICFDLVLSPASKEGYTILVNSFSNLRIHRGRAYHRLWTTSRSYIGHGSSHEPGSYMAHTHSTLAAHPFFSIETTSH